MRPEDYAEIVFDLGATEQQVMLRVYPHVLAGVSDVVEWLQSTTLRPYRTALSDERYAEFVDAFTAKLSEHYGDPDRLLYTFKRILFWARF